MSKPLKVLFGSIATFLLIVVLSVIYLMIGASIFGPKPAVSKACQSIVSGMNLTEATAAANQEVAMDIETYDNTLQISKVSGGWICLCKATLQSNSSASPRISSVNRVFCSD